MRIALCISLGLILITTLGCGTGNKKVIDSATEPGVEKGKINPKVVCRKFPNVSYALYLPQNYTPGLKYPLIIAFDPHASGSLPLEKYKELADKYGYILMGSNDSKNGQDMNTSGIIIDGLFSETSGRYSIDSTRIYVMGFSGGARIASMIGLFDGGVAGVIGAGAGFINTDQQARFKPDYISFAGNSDFNMNELINLDKQLDQANFTHAFILFNGKHEWPPAEIMENAFIWNEFCAMRKKMIVKNDSLINKYVEKQNEIIEADRKTRDQLAVHDHFVNLIRFVDGLIPTEGLKKELADVDASVAYKNQENKLELLIGKEVLEQQILGSNFFTKDIPWWKRQIANYQLRITKGKDSSDVRMCRRLKSYLSLYCYMSYNRMRSSNDTVAARHAMEIYELVDPENAELTKADKVK